MKANELMIGDWVLVHKPTCKGHRVDYINEMEEEIGADGEIYDVCDIKPIPLTAEILEKNGFVWDAYHKQLQLVCGSIHIGWGFYPECLSVSDWEDDGKNQISSLYCKYVHQLQNALRLCGIDKEITI